MCIIMIPFIMDYKMHIFQPLLVMQRRLQRVEKLSMLFFGKLIGFLRAVGDGYSIVYIQDIIVLPEYHRQGIGTQLLRQTLEYFNEVYQIILTTDSELKTIAFYEANGFTALSKYGCTSFMANSILQAK